VWLSGNRQRMFAWNLQERWQSHVDRSIAWVQALHPEGARAIMRITFGCFRPKCGVDALSTGSCSNRSGGPRAIEGARQRRIRRQVFTSLLTLFFLLPGAASAWSQVACKPLLSLKSVRDVRAASTPTIPWRWSATIVADAGHCATRSGNFEIDFVRMKENSPDVQFTEKFRWQHDQFDVSMELTSDESILEFRIGFIAPCVCRPIDQLSSGPRHER
jgi:hypothetical protein